MSDKNREESSKKNRNQKKVAARRASKIPTVSLGFDDDDEPEKQDDQKGEKSKDTKTFHKHSSLAKPAITEELNDAKSNENAKSSDENIPTFSLGGSEDKERADSKRKIPQGGQKVQELVFTFGEIDAKPQKQTPSETRSKIPTISLGMSDDDENGDSKQQPSKKMSRIAGRVGEFNVDKKVSEDDIDVTVKPLLGGRQEYFMRIPSSSTMGELKMALEQFHEVETRKFAIVFQDSVLQDDRMLHEYNVKHKSTLFLVPKMRAGPLNYGHQVNMEEFQKQMTEIVNGLDNAVTKVNEAPGFPPKQDDTYVLTMGPNGQLTLVRLTDVDKAPDESETADSKSSDDENKDEIKLENTDKQVKQVENQKTRSVMQTLKRRIQETKEMKHRNRVKKAHEDAEKERKRKFTEKARFKNVAKSAAGRSPMSRMIVKKKRKHRISRDDHVATSTPSKDNATDKKDSPSNSSEDREKPPEICIAIRRNPSPASTVIREVNMRKSQRKEAVDKMESAKEDDWNDIALWSYSANETSSETEGRSDAPCARFGDKTYPATEDFMNRSVKKSPPSEPSSIDENDEEVKALLESSFIRTSSDAFQRKTVVQRRPVIAQETESTEEEPRYLRCKTAVQKKPSIQDSKDEEASDEEDEEDDDDYSDSENEEYGKRE